MAGVFPFSFIRCRCEVVLGEFLKETKKSPSSVKFAEMANILVIHCQTTSEHMAALQSPPPQKPPPATGEHMAALQSPPPQKPPPHPGQSPGGSGRQCDSGSRSRGALRKRFWFCQHGGLFTWSGPRWGNIWRPCWQAWHQHRELKRLGAGVA